MELTTFQKRIKNYISSAYSYLWITTYEENRVIDELKRLFLDESITNKKKFYIWDSDGCLRLCPNMTQEDIVVRADKVNARADTNYTVENIISVFLKKYEDGDTVIVLKDPNLLLDKNAIINSRILLNKSEAFKAGGVSLICVSPIANVPIPMTKEMRVIEYALPGEADISRSIDFALEDVHERQRMRGDTLAVLTPEIKRQIITASKGMTGIEVQDALALASLESGGVFGPEYVSVVEREKIARLKLTGLSHIKSDVSFNELGGMKGMKKCVMDIAKVYEPGALEFGLTYPKAFLIAGLPGTGKTALAKACAKALNCQLFNVDIGALFGSLVGQTERNFRELIDAIESLGKVVIIFDEMEKSFSKAATSGAGDTGTSSRAFGAFLSWMADYSGEALMIFTSNDYSQVAPELLRKGRFEQMFWVDLPKAEDREEIFKIHIKKKGRDPQNFDLKTLANSTDQFTGAEIEQVVKDALMRCYCQGKQELNTEALLAAARQITPQAEICAETLESLRNNAKGKLKNVDDSGELIDVVAPKTTRRKIALN